MLYLEGLLLGAHCLILPHAVFRGVIIGAHCLILPHAVFRGVIIGGSLSYSTACCI